MIKTALFALTLCAFSAALAETVAWKGMEFGKEQSPKWLSRLVQKGDEKAARKMFGISEEERIIFGVGNAAALEKARTASQTDALKKILADSKETARSLNGFEPVFEHWVQDDKKGFTVVSIYTLGR